MAMLFAMSTTPTERGRALALKAADMFFQVHGRRPSATDLEEYASRYEETAVGLRELSTGLACGDVGSRAMAPVDPCGAPSSAAPTQRRRGRPPKAVQVVAPPEHDARPPAGTPTTTVSTETPVAASEAPALASQPGGRPRAKLLRAAKELPKPAQSLAPAKVTLSVNAVMAMVPKRIREAREAHDREMARMNGEAQ
jgi:hypothetical protein